MATWLAQTRQLAVRLWRFALRIVKRFLANQGILLAGSLAYNSLLSAIPLFAVLVMSLSFFLDEALLLETVSAELRLLFPGQAHTLTETLKALLDARSVLSGVGILVLIFFSSIAFRMLEEAIANIFHVPDHVEGRSFWVSALIPYVYIFCIGVGIVGVTILIAILDGFGDATITFLRWELPVEALPSMVLYISGFIGMTALFASVYKVLPIVEIDVRRALVGGLFAAVLWEIVRRILVWYFASISLVNVIYGSLATVIVVLLSLEIGAVILLLGAQIIAELERSSNCDVPWYEDPEEMELAEKVESSEDSDDQG